MWITNSLQADWMCLLANTSEGAAHKNKSLIIVPMNTPGVTKAQKIRKIGMMSSDTGLIHFDDVRVPQTQPHRRGRHGLHLPDAAVPGGAALGGGERDRGPARAASASPSTTPASASIFGKSVLDNQVVHFRLAELKTEVEALRALTYMATASSTSPASDVTEWASMAKLKCGRLLREVPDACLQYWGGMGYTWDNPVVAPVPRRPARLDRRRRRRGDARHHRQVHAHPAAAG